VTIFDVLFGCRHQRVSFPQTRRQTQRRSEAARQTGTYIVCLDCGKEFAYDWNTMSVVSKNRRDRHDHPQVEAEAKAS
jgi:hypothetical protein